MPAPQRPVAPNRPPAPKQTKNSTILWICAALVAGLVLMGGFVAFLARATDNNSGDDAPAMSDVSKPQCSRTAAGYVAQVQATNSTEQMRDYSVTVAFLRSDRSHITTATARIQDVPPGKLASGEATAVVRESELLFGCEVTSVRRS